MLAGVLAVAGCQAQPERRGEQGGAFYSYVDAQGQLVTIERPRDDGRAARSDDRKVAPAKPEASAASVSTPETASETDTTDSGAAVAGKAETVGPPVATGPGELWNMDDAFYLSDDQIEQKLEDRDRNRFITVHDESGRLVTRRVDMIEAREAARARAEDKTYREIDPAPRVEESEIRVRSGCCLDGLVDAPLFEAGSERALDFVNPDHAIAISGVHPATTLRLPPGVDVVRLRTWLSDGGYVHPQVLLLDAAGAPLALIESPFTRRFPESWRSHAFLEGDVRIPEQAYAAVFFLIYADLDNDRVRMGQDVAWREEGYALRRDGDVTVRALSE